MLCRAETEPGPRGKAREQVEEWDVAGAGGGRGAPPRGRVATAYARAAGRRCRTGGAFPASRWSALAAAR